MSDAPDHQPRGRPATRRVSSRSIVIGVIVVGLVAVVNVAGIIYFMRPENDPLFTQQSLDKAEDRWRQHGPASYDMDIEVSGRQHGNVHVEVRGGQPSLVTYNDKPLNNDAQIHPWTVDGLFDVIRHEADLAENPQHGFPAPHGSRAILRVSYDPRLGYPRRYHRVVTSSDLEIRWKVTRFHAVQ